MIEKIKQSRLMWPVKKVYKYLRFSRFAKPKFFLNNSKGADKVCIILAGYKSFTWEIVFKRIKTFCPEGIDVCIASSGVFSGELKNIAEKNGWSYAAFKRNCVTQVLNSAIKLFPDAKGIFKIDEDIFITEGFFDEIPACLEKAKKDCFPGFCAPLIPVNGYGYTRILQKLNLQKEYENRFEFPKISAGPHMQIESNPDAAKFFWGEGDFVPQIDALNRMLKSDAIRKNKTENTVCGDVCVGEEGGGGYRLCPIRLSIGAIYFERKTLEEAGWFPVWNGRCMGLDETFLCNRATSNSKAIVVSERQLVGHLSFGQQNETMREYFLSHKEIFDLKF